MLILIKLSFAMFCAFALSLVNIYLLQEAYQNHSMWIVSAYSNTRRHKDVVISIIYNSFTHTQPFYYKLYTNTLDPK